MFGSPLWMRTGPSLLAERPRQQGLDDGLAADVQTSRAFIEIAEHALSQIDVDAANRSYNRELVGEIRADVLTAGCHRGDLVRCGRFLRCFPHKIVLLLWSLSRP